MFILGKSMKLESDCCCSALLPLLAQFWESIGSFEHPHDYTISYYCRSIPIVNVSPMSPKLFLSYPHREEYREINLTTLFLWLVLLKLLCNQLKIFVNLTFSQKVWLFVLFWFTGFAELRVLQVQLHCSKKEVTFWLCCGKNVKILKPIICD